MQDSTETVLLKLIRGVHASSITGLSTSTKINETEFLRPLLAFDKKSLLDYLVANGVEWREDVTNTEEGANAYLRNRVRNELVPLLGELSGGDNIVDERVENLVEQIAELNEAVRGTSEENNNNDNDFDLANFDTEDYLQRGSLYRWISQTTTLSYKQMKQVLSMISRRKGKKERGIDVGGGKTVKFDEESEVLWIE